MKKKDWIILACVMALAMLAFVFTRGAKKGDAATVTVYVGETVYKSVSANDYQTIRIDQGDGKVNVIVIDASGVRMDSSTCKNQLCVHQGTIHPDKAEELLLNNWIVCLPNGVSVELVGNGSEVVGK